MTDDQTMHENITIRMRTSPERTLNGYIFSDHAHARTWLSERGWGPQDVRLERVKVGELVRCSS